MSIAEVPPSMAFPNEVFREGPRLGMGEFIERLDAMGYFTACGRFGAAAAASLSLSLSMPIPPSDGDLTVALLRLVSVIESSPIQLDRYLGALADRLGSGVARMNEFGDFIADNLNWPRWPLPIKKVTAEGPWAFATLVEPTGARGAWTVGLADGTHLTYPTAAAVLAAGWIPD